MYIDSNVKKPKKDDQCVLRNNQLSKIFAYRYQMNIVFMT